MKKHLLLVFIFILCLSTIIVHQLSQLIEKEHNNSIAEQARLLHSSIQERFEIVLEGHLAVGVLGSRYFSTHSFDYKDYLHFCHSLISLYPDIVGVTILDQKGMITNICPEERNKLARGLKSQNLPDLLESYNQNAEYWLSGPFELLQSGFGIAFYFPLEINNKLNGWFALPLEIKYFFERLKIDSYLENYHLIIQDDETGTNFFSSSPGPLNNENVYRTRGVMFGRDIHFISWMRTPKISYDLPWYYCALIALFISLLAIYVVRIKQLRHQSKLQLVKINSILDITTREASSALNTIEKRLESGDVIDREQISGFIFYINNILTQLTTSNALAKPSLSPQMKNTNIAPLLREQIAKFEEDLKEQGIEIKVDQSALNDIRINSHKWLLSYSVFGNILRYLIFLSPRETVIKIVFFKDEDRNMLSFHTETKPVTDSIQKDILRRGIDVAKEVVLLSGGELSIIEKGNDYTIALQFKS